MHMKLGKKRQESSTHNYYIISPWVIIKAIIIITHIYIYIYIYIMMMIAFITFKSSLVPLFEGL